MVFVSSNRPQFRSSAETKLTDSVFCTHKVNAWSQHPKQVSVNVHCNVTTTINSRFCQLCVGLWTFVAILYQSMYVCRMSIWRISRGMCTAYWCFYLCFVYSFLILFFLNFNPEFCEIQSWSQFILNWISYEDCANNFGFCKTFSPNALLKASEILLEKQCFHANFSHDEICQPNFEHFWTFCIILAAQNRYQ